MLVLVRPSRSRPFSLVRSAGPDSEPLPPSLQRHPLRARPLAPPLSFSDDVGRERGRCESRLRTSMETRSRRSCRVCVLPWIPFFAVCHSLPCEMFVSALGSVLCSQKSSLRREGGCAALLDDGHPTARGLAALLHISLSAQQHRLQLQLVRLFNLPAARQVARRSAGRGARGSHRFSAGPSSGIRDGGSWRCAEGRESLCRVWMELGGVDLAALKPSDTS